MYIELPFTIFQACISLFFIENAWFLRGGCVGQLFTNQVKKLKQFPRKAGSRFLIEDMWMSDNGAPKFSSTLINLFLVINPWLSDRWPSPGDQSKEGLCNSTEPIAAVDVLIYPANNAILVGFATSSCCTSNYLEGASCRLLQTPENWSTLHESSQRQTTKLKEVWKGLASSVQ